VQPPLYIAARFLIRRQRTMLLSMTGVVLGVAFFVATQAHTRGFEQHYIDTTLGTSGALVISDRFQQRFSNLVGETPGAYVSVNRKQARKYYEGITDPARIMRVVRDFANVVSCTPIVQGSATARSSFKNEAIRLQGIDLDLHLRTTALREQMTEGDLNTFRIKPLGLLLGQPLAQKLEVSVGDSVALIGVDGETNNFTLCGTFATGINIVDENRAYVHLGQAQTLLKLPSAVSMIVLRLRDPNRAPELADHIEALTGHRARSWQEREQGNLQMFKALRISTGVTLTTMILLSGFLIFNAFTTMVLEKTKEIAILRSMGYRRGDISAIFLWQGVMVAAVGAFLGCGVGAALTYSISLIPIKVRGFFKVDHFLVNWDSSYFVQGVGIAFLAVLIASYFPARKAAHLMPVSILRGSGQ
jgi:lipoprotein-releasing system permease protein